MEDKTKYRNLRFAYQTVLCHFTSILQFYLQLLFYFLQYIAIISISLIWKDEGHCSDKKERGFYSKHCIEKIGCTTYKYFYDSVFCYSTFVFIGQFKLAKYRVHTNGCSRIIYKVPQNPNKMDQDILSKAIQENANDLKKKYAKSYVTR